MGWFFIAILTQVSVVLRHPPTTALGGTRRAPPPLSQHCSASLKTSSLENTAGYVQIRGSLFHRSHPHVALAEEKKKKEQGKKHIFIYRCFLLAHFAPQPLQARAAIENQMNSQLLPSNSIRGGKQRPATALEEAGPRRARSGRELLPSLLPQGWALGTRGCAPGGHGGGASPPSTLEAQGCVSHHGLGWCSCSLTFPVRLFPRTDLPQIFLQVFTTSLHL